MSETLGRNAPGQVRDAIMQVLAFTSMPLSVTEIQERVCRIIGPTPDSSVRSYLCLNTPALFARESRGMYVAKAEGFQRSLSALQSWHEPEQFGSSTLHHADCFDWIGQQGDMSIQAVVTDPPYGLYEYSSEHSRES